MGDKRGSSSYSSGDCGGAAGDYHAMTGTGGYGTTHGVSDSWIQKRVVSGTRKAGVASRRSEKFGAKAFSKAKGGSKKWGVASRAHDSAISGLPMGGSIYQKAAPRSRKK